jgi:hypothetical protein
VMRHLRYLNWLPIRLRIDFKQALPIAACVDAVTILCPPPPLLKLLCSTLPFLPSSRLYSPSEFPGCYAASCQFNSPFSHYQPQRSSFLSLLLAGLELSSPVSLLHPQFPLSVPVSRSIC